MKFGKNSAVLIIVVALSACTSLAKIKEKEKEKEARATVDRFINAFNQHDVAAMLVETTDTIAWFAVAGESINSQTRGREQLQQAMTSYFATVPTVHSSLTAVSASGTLVNTIEKATWQNQQGQSQESCSKAVYELEDNKINKVWYFPAEAC